MKKLILGIFLSMVVIHAVAEPGHCPPIVPGYQVVNKSVNNFYIGKDRACFFSFYEENPDPFINSKGIGNKGKAIWYAYYKIKAPKKIKEFPKPLGDDWSMVCTIDAVSFVSMYGDERRDVTVIGSCDRNTKHVTYPFVFMRRGNGYMIDMRVYNDLFEIINLTVSDIQKYIKSPQYISELRKRDK